MRQFYQSKEKAIINAPDYAQEMKQTVYVYKNYWTDQYTEYSLRVKSDLVTLDTPNIIHTEEYIPNNQN